MLSLTRTLSIVLLVAFILSACAPAASPVDQAQADAQVMKATQDAADQAQRLEATKARDAWIQKVLDAGLPIASFMFQIFTIFLFIAVGAFALGMGAGLGVASYKWGQSLGLMADIRARLIYVDKNTGLYPIVQVPKDVTMFNPNDDGVVQTNQPAPAQPDKVQLSGAIQQAGINTRNTHARPLLGFNIKRVYEDQDHG